MANNFSAFFETLVAGADEYNKAKVGRTALLDAVYKDVKPEAARIGKGDDLGRVREILIRTEAKKLVALAEVAMQVRQ